VSRVSNDTEFFDDIEREALRKLIWKMAEFLGIRVLTYAVMGNHFHVLVEVPKQALWLQRFDGASGEEALMQHLGDFYGKGYIASLRSELELLRATKDSSPEDCERYVAQRLEPLKRRFCDLSVFAQELKVRFSRWFNKRRGRKGVLWMDRFKSVLVQKGEALQTMAAYIDLNPVRAGLVEDPKDYKWSGYGEAMGGSRRAQRGLCQLLEVGQESWVKAMPRDKIAGRKKYQLWLYADGKAPSKRAGKVTKPGAKGETSESVAQEEMAKLSPAELVRTRVRHFTQGLAVGSRAWVEEVFTAHRDSFGPKRATGARKLKSCEGDLCALRRLE
jgi:REP element-mobilizing transposase RayT